MNKYTVTKINNNPQSINNYPQDKLQKKRSPKFKPSATIITTCRDYKEWGSFFDCDVNKASSLIALFYGYGCLLNVDEAKEQEPTQAKN